MLECCFLRESREFESCLGSFSLSHFSKSFLVSAGAYNNSKFLYRNVFDTFSEVVVSSKLMLHVFGFLLPASCPLLALGNGVVTYTDPLVDNAYDSFTATHTCTSDGYQLVGDSIRICDISGGTGTWRGAERTCNRKEV